MEESRRVRPMRVFGTAMVVLGTAILIAEVFLSNWAYMAMMIGRDQAFGAMIGRDPYFLRLGLFQYCDSATCHFFSDFSKDLDFGTDSLLFIRSMFIVGTSFAIVATFTSIFLCVLDLMLSSSAGFIKIICIASGVFASFLTILAAGLYALIVKENYMDKLRQMDTLDGTVWTGIAFGLCLLGGILTFLGVPLAALGERDFNFLTRKKKMSQGAMQSEA